MKESGLLILVGKAGVGKTAVRRPLAEALGMRAVGPDDHPYRWDWTIRQVDTTPRVLVECCKIPRALRARMTERTPVVEITASKAVQRKRLLKQGRSLDEADRRVAEGGSIAYEAEVTPTLRVDTTEKSPEQAAQEIAAAIEGEGRVGRP